MEVRHYMMSKTLQLVTSCLTSEVLTAETCVWIQDRLCGVCDWHSDGKRSFSPSI